MPLSAFQRSGAIFTSVSLLCLYLCAAQPTVIFLRILAVLVAELLVVLLYIVEISMEIGLFVCLDKAACNV